MWLSSCLLGVLDSQGTVVSCTVAIFFFRLEEYMTQAENNFKMHAVVVTRHGEISKLIKAVDSQVKQF